MARKENGELLLYSGEFTPIRDFRGQHILSAWQLNPENLDIIYQKAKEIKEMLGSPSGRRQLRGMLEDYVGAALFYEPSTRTRSSFEFAVHRTGARVFTETDGRMSSREKGEPLGHTFRVLTGVGGADYVVIRDPEEEYYEEILPYASLTGTPLINGGDGSREHPFQSAKDYFTWREDFGGINGRRYTFLGDVKYSRVNHSNLYVLSQFAVEINLVSPPEVRAPRELVELLNKGRARIKEFDSLQQMESLGEDPGDAMYVTRLQIERVEKEMRDAKVKPEEINLVVSNLREAYEEARITAKWVEDYPDTNIYHPMPIERVRKDGGRVFRVPGEITKEVDFMKQGRYFDESDNGVPVAAAFMLLVLEGNPS